MVKSKVCFLILLIVIVGVHVIVLTNETEPDEMDSVLWAIITNEPSDLKRALDNGANVDLMQQSDMTENGIYTNNPLRLALDNRHNECLNILIEYGADVNYIDKNGDSLLMCAAAKSDYEKFKAIFDAGADINYTSNADVDVMECAVIAAEAGYAYDPDESYKIISLLNESNLDVYEKDICTLLAEGYNPIVYSLKCVTALYNDYNNKKMKIMLSDKRSLYNLIEGKTFYDDMKFYEIALCVAYDNEELLRRYCEQGNDINTVYNYRYNETLLMVASAFNSVKCAKYLLTNGADINAKSELFENNNEGMVAIDFARIYENEDVLSLLLDYE